MKKCRERKNISTMPYYFSNVIGVWCDRLTRWLWNLCPFFAGGRLRSCFNSKCSSAFSFAFLFKIIIFLVGVRAAQFFVNSGSYGPQVRIFGRRKPLDTAFQFCSFLDSFSKFITCLETKEKRKNEWWKNLWVKKDDFVNNIMFPITYRSWLDRLTFQKTQIFLRINDETCKY